MKLGEYEPRIQRKGINECFLDGVQEGSTFWTVQIENTVQADVKSHIEAEILSRLVRIEDLLKKVKKK